MPFGYADCILISGMLEEVVDPYLEMALLEFMGEMVDFHGELMNYRRVGCQWRWR